MLGFVVGMVFDALWWVAIAAIIGLLFIAGLEVSGLGHFWLLSP